MRGPVDADIAAILIVRLLKTHVMVSQSTCSRALSRLIQTLLPWRWPIPRGRPPERYLLRGREMHIESLLIVADPFRLRKEVAP